MKSGSRRVRDGLWNVGGEVRGGDLEAVEQEAGAVDIEFVGGEVRGGDLEAVEQEAGAVDIEFVGGEAADDLEEGLLEGGGVGWRGDVEAAPGAASVGVLDGKPGGVVVVAEALAAHGGRAAAMGVGEDVVADGGHGFLSVGGGELARSPGGIPPGTFGAKVWA
jgi:hypothetical protein